MKNKIIIEGQEFELPQSLVDEIKERLTPKVKKLTYEDIANKLFSKELVYFITDDGNIQSIDFNTIQCPYTLDSNNATSKKQLKKLLAINKMMNVAKYLNKKWNIDFTIGTTQTKYYLYLLTNNNIAIGNVCNMNVGVVYFKSKGLAKQTIDILGEDVIKLALSTDY